MCEESGSKERASKTKRKVCGLLSVDKDVDGIVDDGGLCVETGGDELCEEL